MALLTQPGRPQYSVKDDADFLAIAGSDCVLLLDDECGKPEMRHFAEVLSKRSARPVISSGEQQEAADIAALVDPWLIVLDLALRQSNLRGGVDWLFVLEDTLRATHICPLTQFDPPSEISDLLARWRGSATVHPIASKSLGYAQLVGSFMRQAGWDQLTSIVFIVSGIHEDLDRISGVVPAWDAERNVVVRLDSPEFDIDRAQFITELSGDGAIRTLVLLGRANLAASEPDDLELWLYGIDGRLSVENEMPG